MRWFEFHVGDEHVDQPYREVSNAALWSNFRDTTTSHGIPHYKNARGWIKRGFWLFMSLVALGALIFHLYYIGSLYAQYNVAVKINILQNYEMEFPAVTICNMNPIKRSAMDQLDLVRRKRRRKKRYADFTSPTCDTIDDMTGLCYGVVYQNGEDYNTNRDECKANGGILALLNDENRLQFIQNNPQIFDSVGGAMTHYYIYLKDDKWMHEFAEGSFENYGPGYPTADKCNLGSMTDHSWINVNCNTDAIGLCQKYVQCPVPVYTNGDGSTSCFVLLDRYSLGKYRKGADSCESLNQVDSHLIELPSQAKFDHLLATGILDDMDSDLYWINLKTGNWQFSGDPLTWSNWASGQPGAEDCTYADRSDNNKWQSAECNKNADVAHIICEIKDLAYVPPVIASTQGETTTVALTTTEEFTSTDVPTTTKEITSTAVPTTTEVLTRTAEPTTIEELTSTAVPTTEEFTTTALPTTTEEFTRTAVQTTTEELTSKNVPVTTAESTSSVQTSTSQQTTDELTSTVQTSTSQQTTDELTSTVQTSTSQQTSVELTSTADPSTISDLQTTSDSYTSDSGKNTVYSTTAQFTSSILHSTATSTVPSSTTSSNPTTAKSNTATTTTSTTSTSSSTVASTTTAPTSTITSSSSTSSTTPGSIPGSAFPERKQTRESFKLEESLTETLASMDEDDKSALGYQAWEFVVDCQHEGVTCSPTTDFDFFYNPIHGNCYTFNSGWNKTSNMQISHKTGRRFGFQVTLNIGQDEYTDQTGGPAGARVVVHSPGILAHPEEQGLLAEPGKLTSISVQKVIVERLPHPHGTCITRDEVGNKDIYMEKFPVNYTRVGCFKTCYQRNVIEQCGCFDSYVPGEGNAFDDLPERNVCRTSNLKEDDCRYNITNEYIKGNLGCDKECPNLCTDTYFRPSVSTASWPSKKHMEKTIKFLGEKIANLKEDATDEKYRENLLQVEIYFEEFNFQKTTEYPAYLVQSFASDVGGILGLWLGFSILSVFEFGELAVDYIILAIMLLKKSKHTPQTVNPASENNKLDTRTNAKVNVRHHSFIYNESPPIADNSKSSMPGNPLMVASLSNGPAPKKPTSSPPAKQEFSEVPHFPRDKALNSQCPSDEDLTDLKSPPPPYSAQGMKMKLRSSRNSQPPPYSNKNSRAEICDEKTQDSGNCSMLSSRPYSNPDSGSIQSLSSRISSRLTSRTTISISRISDSESLSGFSCPAPVESPQPPHTLRFV